MHQRSLPPPLSPCPRGRHVCYCADRSPQISYSAPPLRHGPHDSIRGGLRHGPSPAPGVRRSSDVAPGVRGSTAQLSLWRGPRRGAASRARVLQHLRRQVQTQRLRHPVETEETTGRHLSRR